MSCCDFYEPTAATKGIVIRTFLAADLPLTRIDADLFKQALLNLVLNAEHAMPSGGELMLTTRREEAWVVLDVIDTGVGMTEEVCARIFDAFFSTRPAGSGLGLPTARKIIEAHGGTIQVQSEPGKGSQFTVRLPASEPTAEGQRPLSQEGTPVPRKVRLRFPVRTRQLSLYVHEPRANRPRAIDRWTSRSVSWWSTTMNRTPRPWPRVSSGSATTA